MNYEYVHVTLALIVQINTEWKKKEFRKRLEVTDGQVVRAGISVTWNVLSWSGGHEFETCLGRTWGAWYFCPKSYLNQNMHKWFF